MAITATGIHVRTRASAAVARAFAKLTGAGGVVSDAKGGWVTVYDAAADESAAEQRRLAQALSAALDATALALYCPREEGLFYWLYARGQLRDEWSAETRTGDPEGLLPLCRRGTRSEGLRALLRELRVEPAALRLPPELAAALATEQAMRARMADGRLEAALEGNARATQAPGPQGDLLRAGMGAFERQMLRLLQSQVDRLQAQRQERGPDPELDAKLRQARERLDVEQRGGGLLGQLSDAMRTGKPSPELLARVRPGWDAMHRGLRRHAQRPSSSALLQVLSHVLGIRWERAANRHRTWDDLGDHDDPTRFVRVAPRPKSARRNPKAGR